MPRFTAPPALCLALAGTAALAAPETYPLPEPTAQFKAPLEASHAAGFQAAQENCMTCHSADYIAMQPPRKGSAFWDAEVAKMVKVYRAPIEAQQAEAIAAYLGATY
ncbi:cytochrome c [Methylobacterium sp. P1-11]|uniref:SorB family sulfite dehydrogenase c-type cytochrome subunit n=1 Tax=Methylobacterium sp. P1-11 TaxID=2024616 RepID=UPI0011EF1D49|nr:cytochrome c [Methylobacterium sp. P1-11]KAA0121966.1 cytochrome c [Methylobacterium sp. P1-11]